MEAAFDAVAPAPCGRVVDPRRGGPCYDGSFTQPSWRDDNSAAGARFHAPIALSRLIERYRLGDGRGTIVAGFKPRSSKSFEDLCRSHEVAFQGVHAEQPALVVIEVRQIARTNRLRDNDAEFVTPQDMLAELREDNGQVVVSMRELHDLCDEYGDVATTSLLEVWIDEAERRIWFLFEAERRGE
jgi:hypothetical protein